MFGQGLISCNCWQGDQIASAGEPRCHVSFCTGITCSLGRRLSSAATQAFLEAEPMSYLRLVARATVHCGGEDHGDDRPDPDQPADDDLSDEQIESLAAWLIHLVKTYGKPSAKRRDPQPPVKGDWQVKPKTPKPKE